MKKANPIVNRATSSTLLFTAIPYSRLKRENTTPATPLQKQTNQKKPPTNQKTTKKLKLTWV